MWCQCTKCAQLDKVLRKDAQTKAKAAKQAVSLQPPPQMSDTEHVQMLQMQQLQRMKELMDKDKGTTDPYAKLDQSTRLPVMTLPVQPGWSTDSLTTLDFNQPRKEKGLGKQQGRSSKQQGRSRLKLQQAQHASDSSASDDGLMHHPENEAFARGRQISLLHPATKDCRVLKVSDVVVTRWVRCRTDRSVQKYVVELPDGALNRVHAFECYADWDSAIAAHTSRQQQQQRANDDGNIFYGNTQQKQGNQHQRTSDDGNTEQPENDAATTGGGNQQQQRTSDDGNTEQPENEAATTGGGNAKQGAATGLTGNDDDFDAKQHWCYTTRMLAWRKIRERNPWAQSERMQAWSTCVVELRATIDQAIDATAQGNVPAKNKVDAKYRLYVKGTDAKGQDKDGMPCRTCSPAIVAKQKPLISTKRQHPGMAKGEGAPKSGKNAQS